MAKAEWKIRLDEEIAKSSNHDLYTLFVDAAMLPPDYSDQEKYQWKAVREEFERRLTEAGFFATKDNTNGSV